MKYISIIVTILFANILFAQNSNHNSTEVPNTSNNKIQNHIHWGSTGDPLNGLTVTWHSASFSDSIKWGYTTSYEKGIFSCSKRNDYVDYLYDYAFPTVKAASIIYYSIFSNGEWAHTRTFKTSISTDSNTFSFIAGGDSRSIIEDWKISADKLATESVDFHLFLGDHVNNGYDTTDWDMWWDNGVNFLENNLLYHTVGNHENGPLFFNQFILPENEKWYSYEFGNTLFICLFSEGDYDIQNTWLNKELANTTKEWKVVFFHRPFFTTGFHANEMDNYRSTWWKAFDDNGVDVILNGHSHYYLRSKPINLNVSDSVAVAKYGSNPGEGRLQVVAGSYGAPRTTAGEGWFIETNLKTMNYSKFEINNNVLIMKTYNMQGVVIDEVTITK